MARKSASRQKKARPTKPELILAVTGHRNFGRRQKKVASLVRSELERIGRAHPATPVAVVSALAEGADRLVARLAHDVLGARLVAALPMPADAYEKDFATTASRREFRKLLQSADAVIEGPLLSKGRKWRAQSEERNHQYAWGGAYASKNADVLFALWDGKPARGTGGTAYVVDWFLAGHTPRQYRMSRSRMRRGASPYAARLVHVNPEKLTVKHKRASR
jgi:hypothetical protein